MERNNWLFWRKVNSFTIILWEKLNKLFCSGLKINCFAFQPLDENIYTPPCSFNETPELCMKQNLKIREYFSYGNVIGRIHSKANPPTDSLSWHLFKIIWLSRLYLRQEAHLTYDSVYYQKGEKPESSGAFMKTFPKSKNVLH